MVYCQKYFSFFSFLKKVACPFFPVRGSLTTKYPNTWRGYVSAYPEGMGRPNLFEAGLEAAEGNLVGAANRWETIDFFLGNVVTGDNHFRDWVLFEDFFYGIDCPKDGITIHLLTLISKVIIDKADRS